MKRLLPAPNRNQKRTQKWHTEQTSPHCRVTVILYPRSCGYTRSRCESWTRQARLYTATRSSIINTFSNKIAFITGGAAGIGFGMASAFAARGMKIVIADIAPVPLEAARAELAAAGVTVLALQLDVTDRAAVKAAAAKVMATFGAIHLVCANAGVSGHIGPLQEGSDQDWDWVVDVNLRGSINTVQAFLPYLLKNDKDGHIVLTSSISGLRVHRPNRGQGMYNTTKFALVGYAEALALDLENYGIGVSVVCPGVVNTALSHSGENRPAKYGGAFRVREDFELAKMSSQGTDPFQFGRWVARAIERNQLFVITHDTDRAQVEDRHRRILKAFDDCPDLTRS